MAISSLSASPPTSFVPDQTALPLVSSASSDGFGSFLHDKSAIKRPSSASCDAPSPRNGDHASPMLPIPEASRRSSGSESANASPDHSASPGGSNAPHGRASHTYGFADLGMLGIHFEITAAASQSTSGTPSGGATRSAGLAASGDAENRDIALSAGAEDATSYSPVAQTVFRCAALALGTSSSILPPAINEPTNAFRSPPNAIVEGELQETFSETPSARRMWTPPQIPGADRVSLTLSGADDALAVVARGQMPNASEAETLRGLVERVASEFDVQIGDFVLNGQPAHNATGGYRGSHTR